MGFEGGVEFVVEGAEDGVVVLGADGGDSVLEEGFGRGWVGGLVDGPDCGEKALSVSCRVGWGGGGGGRGGERLLCGWGGLCGCVGVLVCCVCSGVWVGVGDLGFVDSAP